MSGRHITLIYFLFFFNFGAVQSQDTLPQPLADTLPANSFFIIDSILLSGNHRTKSHIIRRELLFGVKDTIYCRNWEEIKEKSTDNLINTSLFNYVMMDTLGSDTVKKIKIHFIERWYLWPFPIFELSERNFNTWWQTKDLNKINYGIYFVKQNFRGRREELKFLIRMGFEEKYNLSYYVPYINHEQTIGMGVSFGLSRNKEVAYRTSHNKQEYFRIEDYYIRQNINAAFQLTYRKDFYKTNYLLLGYNNLYFSDTLIKQNDYYAVNGLNSNKYLSVYYQYKDDHRDNKSYPLNGYYFDFDVTKLGLSILPDEAVNTFYLRGTYRKYFKLTDRFYYASGLKAKLSNNDFQPFFIKQGLGFGNDYVRGYEYYVVDGISYGVNKNNIKFEIIKPRYTKIFVINNEKFSVIHYALYLNVFADCGYAYDYKPMYSLSNTLSNTFLYSYGLGLDVVTYYDKVLRIEYTINKMAKKGFFINFVAPI